MERDEARHQAWDKLVAGVGFGQRGFQLEKPIPMGKSTDKQFFVFQSVDMYGTYLGSFPLGSNRRSRIYIYSLLADDDPIYNKGFLKNPVVHQTYWAGDYDAWLYEYGSRHIIPTLLITRAALESGFQAIFQEAWELRIPLFGVDGGSVPGDDAYHHLFFNIGPYRTKSLHLQWDNREPERWIALTSWLSRAKTYFRDQLMFAPTDDPRTHVAAILQGDSIQWDFGEVDLHIGPTARPAPADALRAFETTLPVPLPIDYRLLFDGEANGSGSFRIHCGDDLLTLFSIEQIQQHRADESIPKTVSHEGQAQHVIPFAQDQQGLLLMELTDTKRVWRVTPDGLQIESETLVSLLTSTIRTAKQLAEEKFDIYTRQRGVQQRRERYKSSGDKS